MPTIGEACQRLGIGRVTLEKWMDRLHITPEKHPQDFRYRVLTDEQVQAIRDERAKMPGHAPVTPPTYTRNALRADSDVSVTRDVSPTVRPVSRQRPLRAEASTPLPDGWMSRTDCADLHGFPRTTLRTWCAEGKIETSSETFGGEHGTFETRQPITAQGMRQFYALASGRGDFQRCDACPHDAEEIAE